MRSRRYLSTLVAASLFGWTPPASAQGAANSVDSAETIPGTSVPADPGPIVGSDVPGRSMPSEITSGSAAGARSGKANSRSPRIRRRQRLLQVQRQAVQQEVADSSKRDKTPLM
jgi:hypothetical protein